MTTHFHLPLFGGSLCAQLILLCLLIALPGSFALAAAAPPSDYAETHIAAGTAGKLVLEGASLLLPAGAVREDRIVSVTQLAATAVPQLNQEMFNLIPGKKAYRFGPSGSTFPIALTLELPYDPCLLPGGTQPEQIAIFYYQPEADRWTQLMPDTILLDQNRIRVKIKHFTDFITGIIKVPESPETQGYQPTEIKDIKAANPSAGITMIELPEASQRGGANLSYPIKLPGGRNGLQPQLTLQYNNQGGHSWVGLGWSLDIPSIGIETQWGVPRYNAFLESETYTYQGSQLWPVAHRDEFQVRTGNKRFFPRVEGAFERIVRHGNSPKNYWWEVTTKEGTRYSYGGANGAVVTNAVLVDDNGNIAQWFLVETRDANDDFIRYSYRKGEDVTAFAANERYIEKITYTGHGTQTGAYEVIFTTDQQLGEALRPDQNLDCRLGFPKNSMELLRRVEVKYRNAPIRKLEFSYTQGAFAKTLLNKISEFDAAGELFFEHGLDYYDEVREDNTYQPYTSLRASQIADDQLSGSLTAARVGFSNELSVLGSSQTGNSSYGGAFTIGLPGSPIAKNNTVGGNYTRTKGKGFGLTTLTDINGDRLPDKVMRRGDELYYRPNLSTPGLNTIPVFGDLRPVYGIKHFSRYESKGHSKGFEANVSPFSLSKGSNKSVTTTHTYLSDFNSDGLIDLARRGSVLFAYVNGQGEVRYTPNSALSPSEVATGANIDPDLLDDNDGDQLTLEQEFPLHDLVQVWQAPKSGKVCINAPVTYLPETTEDYLEYENRDGVRAWIQYADSHVAISDIISETSLDYDFGGIELEVKAGKRIYFRLQSIYDGSFDRVQWNPEIQYVETEAADCSPLPEARDANGRDVNHYTAKTDFHLFGPQSVVMPISGTVSLANVFYKPVTSDNVEIEIILTNSLMEEQVVFQKELAWHAEFTTLNVPDFPVEQRDELSFRIRCGTNVDWSALEWTPELCYVAAADPEVNIFNAVGEPLLCLTTAVEADIYGLTLRQRTPYIMPETGTITLRSILPDPDITVLNEEDRHPIFFTMSIKGENKLYGVSRGYYIPKLILNDADELVLPSPITIADSIPAGEKLFLEIHTENTIVAPHFYNFYQLELKINDSETEYITPGLFSKQPVLTKGFGPMYRGWGHFVYNGNGERQNTIIDEKDLEFDEDDYKAGDIDDIKNPGDLDDGFDPTKAILIVMASDPANRRWIGADDLTYLQCDTVSASRFGEDDLKSINLGSATSGLSAPRKKSVSTGDSYSVGAGIGGGGLSASAGYNESSGTSTNSIEVMDVNGDGYPDLIKDGVIQYTIPTGGLANSVKSFSSVTTQVAKSSSEGATAGGSLSTAAFGNSKGDAGSTEGANQQQAAEQAQNAERQSSTGASVNGGVNRSKDETEQTWIDINGDGLQDIVHSDGTVELNIGYDFLDPRPWSFTGGIRKGTTDGDNLGIGLSFANRSISFGLTLNSSTSVAERAFQDVTGDGLVDRLRYDEDTKIIYLSQNLGTAFAPEIPWLRGHELDKGNAVGESVNVAFTVCINLLFVRICVNPQASTGRGLSRQQTQFADINGDGFPDFLQSTDGDGDLRVRLSRIGKTNMLKSIARPMGSTIVLDYEQTQNSYANPNSVWVLSSAEVTDGLAGDGADTKLYRYRYEGGYRDRHERQFYGFARVTTEEMDTENDNAVYRRRIVDYANDTYYRKGLKLAETTYDADSAIYARMTYEYALRDVRTGGALPAEYADDDGLAFPAKVAETTFFHEGRDTAPLQRHITYDYDTYGNIVRYRDGGDGSSTDWVSAEIDYHNLPNPYIVASPRRIEVLTSEGRVRYREADIDNRGNVTQIRAYLGNGDAAIHDLEYDAYGNLTRLIRPANYQGERMFHAYEYDPAVQTYVTRVTDAYGYSSSATYDYRFGERLSTTDINEQEIRYTLDAKGRMATVTGPYELAAGVPYTIAMDYYPGAPVPYARTRHYEPEHPAHPIETYTFMDGRQRPVQVKKTGFVSDTPDQPGSVRMIVSGRVVFDAFGRTVASYYPTVEAEGNETTFSTTFDAVAPTRTTYDVLDRETSITLPDGVTTTKTYDIAANNAGAVCLYTSTVDPLGNRKDAYLDVRERQCANVDFGPNGPIWTTFAYNPIGELLTVTDAGSNVSYYDYDQLGRKTEFFHPDAGLTTFVYDLSDNLLRKQTAAIRASLGNDAYIRYDYEFQRPTRIAYPRNYQNNVRLHYGEPGAAHNRAGRVWLREDASGGVETFYGPLGETVKIIRTVVVNPTAVLTYISESEYDTWNRIKRMTYPDGEVVTYRYNRAGKLAEMTGPLDDAEDDYVTELRYDKFEQRLLLAYGNGTRTEYRYEPERRRLQTLRATSDTEGPFIAMDYTYDAVDNITAVSNSIELIGAGQLGGSYAQEYRYDELYRLSEAKGEWSRGGLSSSYELMMGYDDLHNITEKTQRHERNGLVQTATTYDHAYQYEVDRPHVPTAIGAIEYTYDANGNLTRVSDGRGLVSKQLIWDEENRLQGHTDNGYLSQYTYDADGERVIKSHGGVQAVFFAGVEAGFINHTENFTVYVSPYLVARAEGFSKHYFIGTQRIASRLGTGQFANNAINGQQGITAGQLDYLERARLVRQAARQFIDPTDSLPPGHPADPDRPIVPLPDIFVASTDYTVPPAEWESALPFGPPAVDAPPGHPAWQLNADERDSVGAGYGWIGEAIPPTPSLYFYHPDHLGSTAYITDISGRVSQHLVYMPFGETFVEEFNFTSAAAAQPYLFNGKELDRETGLYYYGARYYDPATSIWLSLDPLMEKYPGWSPYNYTLQNPVKHIDPDGEDPYLFFDGKSETLGIFDDNGSPDKFHDDRQLGEYRAHNNVATSAKGKWEDGTYQMADQKTSHKHGEAADSKGILRDSPEGSYGSAGIFRAKNFDESTSNETRTGMGVHAGRENKDFDSRVTMGCIRTSADAMEAIQSAIDENGPLQSIIIKNNRKSANSERTNRINPSKSFIGPPEKNEN